MSDTQGLPGKGPQSAQYPNVVDNRTIFGSGTLGSPLTTNGGQAIFGNRSEKMIDAGVSLDVDGAYPMGTPVYESAYNPGTGVGTLTQANASGSAVANVLGLLTATTTGAGEAPDLADAGLFVMSAAQWDAIVQGEAGGLTPDTTYFLNATLGQKPITSVQPTHAGTNQLVTIGVAISPTVMRLRVSAAFLAP